MNPTNGVAPHAGPDPPPDSVYRLLDRLHGLEHSIAHLNEDVQDRVADRAGLLTDLAHTLWAHPDEAIVHGHEAYVLRDNRVVQLRVMPSHEVKIIPADDRPASDQFPTFDDVAHPIR